MVLDYTVQEQVFNFSIIQTSNNRKFLIIQKVSTHETSIFRETMHCIFNGGWAVLGTLDWLIHFKKIGGNLHVFPERPKMI